ncbi:MAG: ABC transporter permease [Chloroflexi bacterium]|nr:ABC transporter permease [Chloroflexota bacterium]
MSGSLAIETIRSVVAASAPLIFASVGETLTEKSGVVNLSLDGTILLSAMTGFAAAVASGSLVVGFAAAAAVGGLVALVVAYGSIALRQNQVAIGFVLTLLCADLSSFLGQPYVRVPGPSVPHQAIPLLADIPVIGRILFDQNVPVYLSYLLTVGAWLWMSRTRPGLRLRSVGERPSAAFARGIPVNRTRYLHTTIGGALVGVGGACYSLSVKLGWSHRHTAGMGWIALAIVIFGGWSPFRVALGAYLFGALKSLGSILQPAFPQVPTQVFQAAPFALMIVALLLVGGNLATLTERLPPKLQSALGSVLQGSPPGALGQPFEEG